MSLYILFFVFLFFFAYMSLAKMPSLRTKGVYTFFVILAILIVGLRDKTVGTDSINYAEWFKNPIWGYNRGQTIEIGSYYWLKLLRRVTTDYRFYFFFSSVVSFVPLSYVIWKVSDSPLFSFCTTLCFVTTEPLFFFELCALRQSMAISLYVLGCYFLIYENKNTKKILGVSMSFLVAFFIHYSALFPIIVTFLLYWTRVAVPRRIGYIFIVCSILFYMVFLVRISDFWLYLSVYFPDDIQILEYDIDTDKLYSFYSYSIMIIPANVLALFYLQHISAITKPIITNYMIFTVCLINLLISLPIGFRVILYFLPLFIVFTLGKLRLSPYRNIIILIIFFFFAYRGYSIMSSQNRGKQTSGNIVCPYKLSI